MEDYFDLDEGLPNVEEAHTIHFEQLKFEEEIGTGSFGSVYKGTYLGTPVAIKKIAKSEDLQEELDIFVQREASMAKYTSSFSCSFIHSFKPSSSSSSHIALSSLPISFFFLGSCLGSPQDIRIPIWCSS